MADESSHPPDHQDSDYDGAWKEALRLHLPEFIEKYFPAEHAAIDWSKSAEWLDKELSQVLSQPGQRNREVFPTSRLDDAPPRRFGSSIWSRTEGV